MVILKANKAHIKVCHIDRLPIHCDHRLSYGYGMSHLLESNFQKMFPLLRKTKA